MSYIYGIRGCELEQEHRVYIRYIKQFCCCSRNNFRFHFYDRKREQKDQTSALALAVAAAAVTFLLDFILIFFSRSLLRPRSLSLSFFRRVHLFNVLQQQQVVPGFVPGFIPLFIFFYLYIPTYISFRNVLFRNRAFIRLFVIAN